MLESLSNNKKLEQALNQWMERVEEQVQAIDETLNDKASMYELQSIENKLQLEIRERGFQSE